VANQLRILRPYLEVVPPELRPALQLAQGLMARLVGLEGGRPFPNSAGPNPHTVPLRYRVADGLNAVAKRVPFAHALVRALARLALRGGVPRAGSRASSNARAA